MGMRRGGLFAGQRPRRWGCLALALPIVAAALVFLSLTGLSNRFARLETRRVTFVELPKALEKFRILHLSDLHAKSMGNGQENVTRTLGREDWDVVVFSGDMVGRGGNDAALLDLLKVLGDKAPVYFVAGDEDPEPFMSAPHGDSGVYAPWVQKAVDAGAVFLEAPRRMEIGGAAVWFVPGDMFFYDLPNALFAISGQITLLEGSPNPFEEFTAARLRLMRHRLDVITQSIEAFSRMEPGDAIVAVSHHPPSRGSLRDLASLEGEGTLPKPGLFLCGQFNGGQIRLPGLGPVYIPRQADGSGGLFPGDEGFTGLSITQGIPVYVSPGLGVSGYYPVRLRLFNRPALTIIEMTRKMTR